MLIFCLDNDLTNLLFLATVEYGHPAVFVWHENKRIVEFESCKIQKILIKFLKMCIVLQTMRFHVGSIQTKKMQSCT